MSSNTSLNLNTLTLACWNARGIMSSVPYLCQILNSKNIDICVLTEHWLYNHSLSFLDSLDLNFMSYAKCDRDLSGIAYARSGRGKGGVAIMYNRKLSHCISRVNFDDDRLLAIEIRLSNNKHFTVIGAYLPSSDAPPDVFISYIDKLDELISYVSTYSSVAVLGDMNTQLNGTRYRCRRLFRTVNLESLLDTHDLFSLTPSTLCTGPCYTFDPFESGSNRTLIDHIIISKFERNIVRSCEILSNCHSNTSDHLAVVANFAIGSLCSASMSQPHTRYRWHHDASTRQHLSETYGHSVETLLNEISVPCDNEASQNDLNSYYNSIVKSLHKAAEDTVPKIRFSPFLKPRWNTDIAAFHAEMREKRRAWIQSGRPRGRHFIQFVEYKEAKRIFRAKLRNLYVEIEQEFYASVDEAASIDHNLFWCLINRKRKRKGITNLELTVGDTIYREPVDKLNVWKNYFSAIYSPSSENTNYDVKHMSDIENKVKVFSLKSCEKFSSVLDDEISHEEISSAVRSLRMKKAPGYDTIVNEHIVFGGDVLKNHLKCVFNLCLKLEHFPTEALYGVIVPIPKSSKNRASSLKDYRGITLLSCLYKLFEKIILERLRQFSLASGTALSHPLQFAYKRQSCSLMTSFTLQETVNHFLERSSVVYCCFLDAASAFDVVWHDGLLYKLYELCVNGKMWRILRNIYSNMNSCISLDGLMSDWFPIKQSVRQGGVLSAWLYIIYVNELLVELEKRSLGTYIHNTFYGSPMQADDLALLSICKQDLDNMIKICYEYPIKWRYTLNLIR